MSSPLPPRRIPAALERSPSDPSISSASGPGLAGITSAPPTPGGPRSSGLRGSLAIPATRTFEESQGVKWVDYLEDKYMFRGLVRERGEQSFEHLRLLVRKKD